jgi:hypothetical protein
VSTGLNEEWASLQTELSAAESEMEAVQEQLVAALRDKEEAEDSCEKKVRDIVKRQAFRVDGDKCTFHITLLVHVDIKSD